MDKIYTNKLTIIVLLLPALILFVLFVPIPTISVIVISLFKSDSLNTPEFVGLNNYKMIFFNDNFFWNSFMNNLKWLAGCFFLQVIPAFFLALMLSSKILKGRTFFKGIIFFPVLLSSASTASIWYFVYHGKIGILNQLIRMFTNLDFDKSWLLDPKFALWGVLIASAWQFTGYYMVLFLAGISTIPGDIIEAAKIDGANGVQTLIRIILPYLRPVIQVVLVLLSIGAFKGFDLVYVLTKGGPNHASELLALNMFENSFNSMMYGYGSAYAVIILFLCVFLTLVINKIFNRKGFDS